MDMLSIGIVLLGLLMGFIGGFAGIGGSPFMVAALVLGFGYSQVSAQATMTYMMLGPITLLGILSQKDKIYDIYKVVIPCIFSYGIASYFGAGFAIKTDANLLILLFSSLLFFLGFLEIYKVLLDKEINSKVYLRHDSGIVYSEKGKCRPTLNAIIFTAFVTGFIGGFFGIGAGVLLVFVLINIFAIEKNQARLISMSLLLLPVGIGAVFQYLEVVPIDYQTIALLFISYFFSNYFGARVGNNQSEKSFKLFYGLLLILTSTIYFIKLL
jgi:uncharacterized protein